MGLLNLEIKKGIYYKKIIINVLNEILFSFICSILFELFLENFNKNLIF